jgi:hypothetical protein
MKAEFPIYGGGVTEPQIHHERCEFWMLLNPICLRQEALGVLCSLSLSLGLIQLILDLIVCSLLYIGMLFYYSSNISYPISSLK